MRKSLNTMASKGPGLRPPTIKPKGKEDSPSGTRRPSSPRTRTPSITTKPTPRAVKDPNAESKDPAAVDPPVDTDELSPSENLSPEPMTPNLLDNKEFLDFKEQFEKMVEENSKLNQKVSNLETKQVEQLSNLARIVSSQVKPLLARIVSLEEYIENAKAEKIVINENVNHYAMTDERTATAAKPELSDKTADTGTDETTPTLAKPELSDKTADTGNKDVVLNENVNHYAMTDERTATAAKPELPPKKGMLSRFSIMRKGSSQKLTGGSFKDGLEGGKPPADTQLLTKPKSVIQQRAEKQAQQQQILSAAMSDDREEWEKRADGDVHSMNKDETDPVEVALTLRERIALRRGSTRDLDKVIELGKSGRLSLELQQTALGNMFDAKGAGVSIDIAIKEKSPDTESGTDKEETDKATGGTKDDPTETDTKNDNKQERPKVQPKGKFKMGNMLLSAHRKGDLEKAVVEMEDKAVLAEKEVVVVAKTLELSEEEKAMNGAPEGKLFVVEIIPRAQLPKFDSDAAVTATITDTVLPVLGSDKENEWNCEFDALTFLRRILIHHPQNLDSQIMGQLVPGLEKCARNTRSVLAKNAVCCIEDLFMACGAKALLDHSDSITLLAGCLLDSCATNMPKALRSVAVLALDQATANTTPETVLNILAEALVSRSSHKNKEVAVKAVTYATKSLSSLQKLNNDFAANLNLEVLLGALHFGLNGKAPEGKRAAKEACMLISCSKGLEAYKEFIQSLDSLSTLQREELIKAGDDSEQHKGQETAPQSPSEMRAIKMKELRAQAKAKAKAKVKDAEEIPESESTSL